LPGGLEADAAVRAGDHGDTGIVAAASRRLGRLRHGVNPSPENGGREARRVLDLIEPPCLD
jgi:hypothetical protein